MDSITICRTCPRGTPESGVSGTNLRKLLEAELQACGFEVLMVHCLGNCRLPCSVALDSSHNHRIRFSGVDVQDAKDLIDAAIVYSNSKPGVTDIGEFAPALVRKISAISPKFPIVKHSVRVGPNHGNNTKGT